MDTSIKYDGFQLYDPRCGALYHLYTANAAIDKADQLGASRFQFRAAAGQCLQVEKHLGQWSREDGKPLGVVQRAIDSQAYVAILARAAEREAVPAGQATPTLDREHAVCDLLALRSIQDSWLREVGVAWMVNVACVSTSYCNRLDTARRVVSDQDLVELNAALAAAGIAA